jgi:plasmid maintenance system antidote protein VapI
MKLYDYLPAIGKNGSIREEPRMKKPSSEFIQKDWEAKKAYWEQCKEYLQHLHSLPLYPVSKKMPEWVGRKPQEGIDFEFFECDDCDGTGSYEGGKYIETFCTTCNGQGVVVVPKTIDMEKDEEDVFNPDWRSHPLNTIIKYAILANTTFKKMGEALHMSDYELRDFLSKKTKINDQIAEGLQNLFGVDKQFWLNKQINYDKPLTTDDKSNNKQ